jgi:HlyD family type I secretion membrane fusion protein
MAEPPVARAADLAPVPRRPLPPGEAALGPVPPRPPIGRLLLAAGLVMLAFFGGFGAWAALAPIASSAIAPGTVRVEGNRRTVQHLEGGIIEALLVKEDDTVAEGQPLIRLDRTAAQSRFQAVRHQHDLLKASEARLLAERARAERLVFPPALEAERHEPRIATLLAGQEQIFLTRRQSYQGQRAILAKRIEQLGAQILGLEAQIAAAERQLELLAQEDATVDGLVRKGLEREARLLELRRRGAALDGSRAESLAEIARVRQAIGETELRILALDDEQAERVEAELEKVQAELARVEEELVAAADVLRRRDITAPLAGRVVNLRYFTRGGVIQPATPILDVVPAEDRLLIEAQVSPLDIDVVRPGLEAEIRLSAYKMRATPIIYGRLLQVSADRFVDERTGAAYYKALAEAEPEELARLEGIELYPGMPAEVMIKTGERTFLAYLLQPLADSFARAFREQ